MSAIALLLVGQSLITSSSVAAARTLKPRLGRTAIVAAVSGRVRLRPRGARSFVRLEGRRLIGFGAAVDASHGSVRLVTARGAAGGEQSGVFDGGAFVVTQDRSGVVDLLLTGGRRAARACGAAAGRDPQAAAALSAKVLRLLHGRAHG
ncbi:MAG: hypothetical protein ACXVFA_08370, partial [Solirubrobacteraceae bacterium]